MVKVFVINKPMRMVGGNLFPTVDISPAAEFGRLTYVLPDGELQASSSEIIEDIGRGLKGLTKDDHILLSGDPRAMVWSGIIAARRTGGTLSLLRWIRNERRYVNVKVTIPKLRAVAGDKRRPIVYVVNQPMRFDRDKGSLVPSIDPRPAEAFGELEFVLPDGELQGAPSTIVAELAQGLKGFRPTDHLLLTGDQCALVWAAAIVDNMVNGTVPLLHWMRAESRYRSIKDTVESVFEEDGAE